MPREVNKFAIRLDLLGRILDPATSSEDRELATTNHIKLTREQISYKELYDLGYGLATSPGVMYQQRNRFK